MGQIIGWAIVYLLIAALAGWWPFKDSAVKTMTGQCTYEAGYQDGWDGASLACKNTEYLTGYDLGDWEADCHFAKCIRRDRQLFDHYLCGRWDEHHC